MRYFFSVLTLCFLFACQQNQTAQSADGARAVAVNTETTDPIITPDGEKIPRVIQPEEWWREKLTKEEFYILRQAGTERAFTSELNDNKADGVYVCAGCNFPLFSSGTKFKSGTGWPSFYQPINAYAIAEKVDNSYGMRRVEVVCNRCFGHQGHVFEDGPEPTGLRYCINGDALDFVQAD